MSRTAPPATLLSEAAAAAPPVAWLGRSLVGPVLLAAGLIALATFAIVMATPSAWRLLGVGRGLVPEAYYHYSGFVILLGTTFGQAVGWAAGSALLAYVYGVAARRPVTPAVVRGAMALIYLGLATVPLAAYHVLFGEALLGLEREGLPDWLGQHYPDAYSLLYTAHPLVDLSLGPLTVAVLAILWRVSEERLAGSRTLQTVLLLLILATSLAVALSLAIHATLAHIRF